MQQKARQQQEITAAAAVPSKKRPNRNKKPTGGSAAEGNSSVTEAASGSGVQIEDIATETHRGCFVYKVGDQWSFKKDLGERASEMVKHFKNTCKDYRQRSKRALCEVCSEESKGGQGKGVVASKKSSSSSAGKPKKAKWSFPPLLKKYVCLYACDGLLNRKLHQE